MNDIYDVTVVTLTRETDFHKAVDREVEAYQTQGLEVEVQFSTCSYGDYGVRFTAFITARKVHG